MLECKSLLLHVNTEGMLYKNEVCTIVQLVIVFELTVFA